MIFRRGTYHLLLGVVALIHSFQLFGVAFEQSDRLRPFSFIGWHREVAILACAVGVGAILMLLTSGQRSATSSRLCAALVLGIVSAAAYTRWFSYWLAALSFSALGDASLSALFYLRAARSWFAIVVSLAVLSTGLAWGAYLMAGFICVGM